MARQGPVVRVDRGDGHLFNIKEGDFKEYLAANPGAKLIGRRPTHDDTEVTQREHDATAAQDGDDSDLGKLKKDELVSLAEERGIDSIGTKAEIIERLEAQGA